MNRTLTTLVIIATLLLGCASGSRSAISRPYDARHANQIQVTVENYVHRDVTVYIMNGGLKSRIGRCSMGARCNWWLTSARSRRVADEGTIVLGCAGRRSGASFPTWTARRRCTVSAISPLGTAWKRSYG